METDLLLAIDIGTSSCKLAIFNGKGDLIDSESENYPVYYPHEGWAEQEPQDWWEAVKASIKLMLDRGSFDPKNIKGIGVAGQSWAAVPVDISGNVLHRTPLWMDTRAQKYCDELNHHFGNERLFEISGNSLQPSYSLPKIMWFKNELPEIYQQTHKFLQSNSFIVYKLTNEYIQDISQAYGYQFFDMKHGDFKEELFEEVGIDFSKIPNLVKSHEVVGHISEQASKETGLPIGIPVVAGGLDAACGALGVGVIDAGETQEQGGQAGGMSICLDEYKANPNLIMSYHVVPNKWLLQGGTVGGAGVPRWFLKHFGEADNLNAQENGTNPYYEMDKIAQEVSVGSDGMVFLPYMAGERSPIWNPNAKGVFYGVDFAKTRGHFIRAIEEGVAYSLKHNLLEAEQLGIKIDELKSMGGAANSKLWMQIKADVTNKPIEVISTDSATTWGAAILAGVGVGLYSSFEEAIKHNNEPKAKYTPKKDNVVIYKDSFNTYLQIYKQLEELMNK